MFHLKEPSWIRPHALDPIMNIYMDPTYGLSIKLYEKWFGKILQNFLSSAVYESLPLQYSVPNQNA